MESGSRDATMIGLSRGLGRFILAAGALAACAGVASAQTSPDQPPSNSVCSRLEAQLATVDRGTPDPARADLISHAEEAIAKQQADLDRLAAQSRTVSAAKGSRGSSPCSPASHSSASRSTRRSSRSAAISTA